VFLGVDRGVVDLDLGPGKVGRDLKGEVVLLGKAADLPNDEVALLGVVVHLDVADHHVAIV